MVVQKDLRRRSQLLGGDHSAIFAARAHYPSNSGRRATPRCAGPPGFRNFTATQWPFGSEDRLCTRTISDRVDLEDGDTWGDVVQHLVGGVLGDVAAEEGADLPRPLLQVQPECGGLVRVADLLGAERLDLPAELE